VEQSTEQVAPSDLKRATGRCGRRIGSAAAIRASQGERSVWTLLVEVADVDAEDMLEVAATEDQEPVETLPAHAADPAFGVGVRVRRLDRRSHDLDAFAAEDAVEGAAELRGRGSGSAAVGRGRRDPSARLRACWVGLMVLTFRGNRVAAISFPDTSVFRSFGLPRTLPE